LLLREKPGCNRVLRIGVNSFFLGKYPGIDGKVNEAGSGVKTASWISGSEFKPRRSFKLIVKALTESENAGPVIVISSTMHIHKTAIFEAAFFPETPCSFICALLNKDMYRVSSWPVEDFCLYPLLSSVFMQFLI
jgi:hypothetical protein